MNILINGSEIAYHPQFPLTWGIFFSDLYEQYVNKDHGIVKVLLDKNESLLSIKMTPHEYVPENILKVEVFTKNTLEITKEGFIKMFALTDSIRCEIPAVVQHYRNDQTKAATGKIKKILETIKPMIDFVNSVGINFSLNFDELFSEQGFPLRKEIGVFLKSFSALVNIQGKNNNLETADYLENQFTKDISTWNQITKTILRKISNRASE